MSGFTKALRQRIVREFAVRHNGTFNPALFLDEVRRVGPSHPAHAWFDWNTDEAARKWQVEQAREFARDLRVTFQVEEVGRTRAVSVRERAMPLVLSPLQGRRNGGGYILTDPDNPEHMQEHCAQAAQTLAQWVGRYRAAVDYAGMQVSTIEAIIGTLAAVATRQAA